MRNKEPPAMRVRDSGYTQKILQSDIIKVFRTIISKKENLTQINSLLVAFGVVT